MKFIFAILAFGGFCFYGAYEGARADSKARDYYVATLEKERDALGQISADYLEERNAEESERREHDSFTLAALKEAQSLLREYEAESEAAVMEERGVQAYFCPDYKASRARIDAAIEKMESLK